eukprot:TRINITY_DN110923_c0_g1_i1.p1 TRINITY_DN110923_c0_g1~~TRINITY_DN110923_c0_g1_i1.p1  ORF type:complete len:319 (-),score=95.64 TRINITY_DN110923_c0_g1_i1:45-1001(-)
MLGEKRPLDQGDATKRARLDVSQDMTPDEAEFFRLTGIMPDRMLGGNSSSGGSSGSDQTAAPGQGCAPVAVQQMLASSPVQQADAADAVSAAPAAFQGPGMGAGQVAATAVGAMGTTMPAVPAAFPGALPVPALPAAAGFGFNPQMLMGQMMQQQMFMQMMAQTAGQLSGTQAQEEAEEDEDPLNPDNDPNRFTGKIKGFYDLPGGQGGFGFIDCDAAKMKYGRDVYLHSRQAAGAEVGEVVSFTIVRNAKGEPQARNVMRASEAAALKAKIQQRERKEAEKKRAKYQGLEKVSVPEKKTGVMTEEEAKRFQESLRRR